MEFRNSRYRKEYKELQKILTRMGCYEEGMELGEMRQVLDVLQKSSNESETTFSETDMQQALRESQLGSVPPQEGPILNSTMMSVNINTPPSDCSDIETIVVQAQVHHAMNWSASTDSLPQKRSASTSIETDIPSNPLDVEACNQQLEPTSKRFSYLRVPHEKSDEEESSISNSLQPSYKNLEEEDTSTSCALQVPYKKLQEEESSNSLQVTYKKLVTEESYDSLQVPRIHLKTEESYNSLKDVESLKNSAENIREISVDDLHEIRGPVSERRTHDSGLIEGYEISHSSSSLTVSNLISSSAAGSSNLQPSDSVHEIHGPISIRITQDSGLNLSTEAPNSSSVSNAAEHSISSLENSPNRAENQNESNQDFEH